MKTVKITLLAFLTAIVFSCKDGNDDSVTPVDGDIAKMLVGKTWVYSGITGSVNYGGKIKGDVAVFKDGKSQYGFIENLSKTSFTFKERGKAERYIYHDLSNGSFFDETDDLEWEVSSDKKKILIWLSGEKDIAGEWEIKSVLENNIQVKEKDWSQIVTDHKLTDDTTVIMDVIITLIPKK